MSLKSIYDIFLYLFNVFKPAFFLPIFDKTMRDTACLPYVTRKRSVIGLKLLKIIAAKSKPITEHFSCIFKLFSRDVRIYIH